RPQLAQWSLHPTNRRGAWLGARTLACLLGVDRDHAGCVIFRAHGDWHTREVLGIGRLLPNPDVLPHMLAPVVWNALVLRTTFRGSVLLAKLFALALVLQPFGV